MINSLLKLLRAAVIAVAESAKSIPAIFAKTNESFVRFKVSSTLKPCLANSKAALEASAKLTETEFAALNISEEKLVKLLELRFKIEFISAILLSTSTVDVTNKSKDLCTTKIAEAEAPNANTRALAAAIDFSNSEAEAVILPSGCWILDTLMPLME